MGLSDLPTEILEIILSYCNKDTLQSVSLVSPYLHGPAIQHLYRYILPADGRRTISLLWALVHLPFAAASVRTLHVRGAFCLARDIFKMPEEMDVGRVLPWGISDAMTYWSERATRAIVLNQTQESKRRGASLAAHPSQEEDHFFDNTMNSSIPVILVEKAFRNMTSLQKLVIHSPAHPLMWAFSYEIPALKHVTIHQNAASPLLLCWLAKQSALTSIEYFPDSQYIDKWFPSEGPEVESHFLPHLREIMTNVGGAVLFVPGRPVESVHMRIPKGEEWPTEVRSELEQDEDYATGYPWREYVTRRSSLRNIGRALLASTRPIQKLGLSPASVTVLGPFLRLAVETFPAALTHLTITMDYEKALNPLLEQYLGLLPRLLFLEVPSDHSIPAEQPEPKKAISGISSYVEEHKSKIRDNQLTKVVRWANLAPVLHTVILHPESPIMSSVSRHSAMHGTGKYESLIVEWSIRRDGSVIQIVPVEQ